MCILQPNDSANDFVYRLTRDEVKEASVLEGNGCQRLRALSPTKKTIFYFTISLEDRGQIQVVIAISPVCCPASEHCHRRSDVQWNYQLGDGQVFDSRLVGAVKVVYDTYILANRQTFDSIL
jgi:hypothetical protein